MKNSFCLTSKEIGPYRDIARFDHVEIDNPDTYSISKMNYINRINKIIRAAKGYFLPSTGVKIADFGCAQGNTALKLAELGYKVIAIDIQKNFIEYAKLKYEKGDIDWVCSNIEDCHFENARFDMIILGELIEHCAFPERIVDRAAGFLKKGGILLITTPNADYYKNKLPAFSSLDIEKRELLKGRQFGPDGPDHLFLFKMKDIGLIVPRHCKIVGSSYMGTAIFNRFSVFFFRLFPHRALRAIINVFERLPLVNKYLSPGIFCVVQKQGSI